ncbi:MAG TPA: alpha/beta hydrolase [Caulobacteraceae bacterium]|jgi:pimeloyl-ACP methyl ester carboxylesterase|nr:alpha/beta hydrolase [Caulobacteraceae bacterium]
MPSADLNGQTIYYEDTGGDGPVVVFSHGFLLDTDLYRAQVAALRSRYRCIVWDQRGFGRTGPAPESFTYWDSARDVLALMDHCGVKTATLAGLSQGGFLSLRAAALAPERVEALVLISTRAGLDNAETIEGFRNLKAEWQANGSTNVADFLAGLLLGDGADRAPWFAKWAAMERSALAHPLDALMDRDDFTARASEIACPVLVLHGEADPAIDVAHGRTLAAEIGDNAALVLIPGAGHAPPLTHPEAVTAAMADFLSRQAKAQGTRPGAGA